MKKLFKSLFLTAILGISLFLSVPFTSTVSANIKPVSVTAPAVITTEKVVIDGITWIYVYEDGIFVHRYLDDEGD